jgi:hypothetical protein
VKAHLTALVALLAAAVTAEFFPDMKSLAVFFLCVAAGLLFTGCASTAGKPDVAHIQKLIDDAGLDPAFKGSIHLREAINVPGSVGLDVTVRGLRREGDRWVWTSLEWRRHGVWTNGNFDVTPDAK